MSNLHKFSSASRHARLFELIRQRNLAKDTNKRISEQPDANAADVRLFRLQAEKSLIRLAG